MNKNCNVMILGGGGFIGSNLSAYLSRKSYNVSVFDMRAPENPVPGVRYMEGNFFDERSLDVLTEGQDIVIHALSTVTPGNSNRVYMRGYGGDFLQTIHLLDRLSQTRGKLQTFNISTGVGTSQNEIIALFEKLGLPVRVNYLSARTVDAKYNIASNDKIVAALGCTCCSIEEGVTRYLDYLGIRR